MTRRGRRGASPAPPTLPPPFATGHDFGRRFHVTDVIDGVRRRPADDVALVPPGPWLHLAGCACELCRLGSV